MIHNTIYLKDAFVVHTDPISLQIETFTSDSGPEEHRYLHCRIYVADGNDCFRYRIQRWKHDRIEEE